MGFRYLFAPAIKSSAAFGMSGLVQKITMCENMLKSSFSPKSEAYYAAVPPEIVVLLQPFAPEAGCIGRVEGLD